MPLIKSLLHATATMRSGLNSLTYFLASVPPVAILISILLYIFFISTKFFITHFPHNLQFSIFAVTLNSQSYNCKQ